MQKTAWEVCAERTLLSLSIYRGNVDCRALLSVSIPPSVSPVGEHVHGFKLARIAAGQAPEQGTLYLWIFGIAFL